MLEKICTDLETSKRLGELDFESETKFYWENDYLNANAEDKIYCVGL